MDIEKSGRELQIWRTKSMAAWKYTAEANAIVLQLMIKGMAENKDEIPTQLVESVNIISLIPSDIEVFAIIQLY